MRACALATPNLRRRERLIDLVNEALDVARRHIEETGHDPLMIEIRISIPESLTAKVARHQILSVFTNLVRNAFEAFRPLEDEIGRFWISVSANTDGDRFL